MTHLTLFVLLWLVGENSDFLALAVLNNCCVNSSLCAILACLKTLVCANCKYVVKCNL